MKGKKVLKILMAAMVIVTMLAQVSVFAETTPYFTTSTVYDVDTEKAKVTSTVYGIGDGEEITFLVERGTEILYIDQVNENDADQTTVADSSATFTYLVDAADADGTAEVKFASTTNAASVLTENTTNAADKTITLGSATVTYNAAEGGVVFLGEAETELEDSTETSGYVGQVLQFYVAPNAGYIYSDKVLVNDVETAATASSGVVSVEIPAENSTIEFVFAATTQTSSAPAFEELDGIDLIAKGSATVDGVGTVNTVDAFASIAMDGVKEFGVLVSKSEIAAEPDLTDSSIRKFAAAGHIDGKYGVQLVDNAKTYLNETVYVRTYAIVNLDGTDNVVVGDSVQLDFSAYTE